MSQLLNEMDGLEPLVNVIIVAATNKPDIIVIDSCIEFLIHFYLLRIKPFCDLVDLIDIFIFLCQTMKVGLKYLKY